MWLQPGCQAVNRVLLLVLKSCTVVLQGSTIGLLLALRVLLSVL